MYSALFLLQTAAGAEGAEGAASSPWSTLILFGSIIVVFYFFMIRPQQKRQKEEANFRNSIQKGDKIVTVGGIMGRVSEVKDDYVVVEVDGSTKLRFKKASINPDKSDQDGK